jgi:hypothetical protein
LKTNNSSVLTGVIATSPLIVLSKPASKFARWMGGKAGLLLPNVAIPADTKAEVSYGYLDICQRYIHVC